MKQLLVIVVLAILVTPIFNASEIPETACPIIYDFSNVEVGDGGQDFVTNVEVGISPDAEPGPFNIDLYDWLGNYIESTYFDSNEDYSVLTGMPEPPGFTGLVDGTYTFIVNDTYKGTFNVNHEMQGLVSIDMSKYNQCNHDAYGGYRDPNTSTNEFYDYPQDNHDDDNYYGYDYNNDNDSGISMTNIESTPQSETSSYSTTVMQSEVGNDDVVIRYGEQNAVFYAFSLPYIVIAILLIVIVVLILVIYKLKKVDTKR